MILTNLKETSKESILQMSNTLADFMKTDVGKLILWELGLRREKVLNNCDMNADEALGRARAHKQDYDLFNELDGTFARKFKEKSKQENDIAVKVEERDFKDRVLKN